MQGSTVCSMGMLAGLSLTITGARMEPIMPPTAPEPAMAAVETILSDSPNQVWLTWRPIMESEERRYNESSPTLVLRVIRKGCPRARITWPVNVSQNLVLGEI